VPVRCYTAATDSVSHDTSQYAGRGSYHARIRLCGRFRLLTASAAEGKGDAQTMSDLAGMYADGHGVAKDETEAFACSGGSGEGVALAMYNPAICMRSAGRGEGRTEAARWVFSGDREWR